MKIPLTIQPGTIIMTHSGNPNKTTTAKFIRWAGKYLVVSKYYGNDMWSGQIKITENEVVSVKE